MALTPLYLYCQQSSPRLAYIAHTLFQALGVEVRLTHDWLFFSQTNHARINYSNENLDTVLQVQPHPILFDTRIKDYKLEVHKHDEFRFIFFKSTHKTALPFDLLAASFWLLTRYEEYLPFSGDKHQRFQHKNSLAWQSGFLQIPLIHYWMQTLVNQLQQRYPLFKVQVPIYSYLNSIDVDSAYRYRHKGFVRTVSGILNDVYHRNTAQLKERVAVVLNRKNDPFDVYAQIEELHQTSSVNLIYFFLLGDYGLNDKNHSATNAPFQTLIKQLSDYHQTGLHPSFKSNYNEQQLKIEAVRLSQINHKPVTKSRQHFSRLHFPQTYQSLITAGIEHDYSLGYNQALGFRASYCYPYKWYNLEEEQVTGLTLHPFCCNEVALAFSKVNEAKDLLSTMLPVINEVKKFGGELITVFHNDSFSIHHPKNYFAFYEAVLNACQNPL